MKVTLSRDPTISISKAPLPINRYASTGTIPVTCKIADHITFLAPGVFRGFPAIPKSYGPLEPGPVAVSYGFSLSKPKHLRISFAPAPCAFVSRAWFWLDPSHQCDEQVASNCRSRPNSHSVQGTNVESDTMILFEPVFVIYWRWLNFCNFLEWFGIAENIIAVKRSRSGR